MTVQLNPFGFSPPSYPVGAQPGGVAAADLTNDGADDLIVANAGSDDLSILLNDGSGAFGSASSVSLSPLGAEPGAVGTGNFNSDGNADVAVAISTPPSVAILIGNGTGGLSLAGSFGVGSLPSGVGVGDFNGDQRLDLAVPSADDDEIAIALGKGGGTFAAPTELSSINGPQGIVVDDYNGDGDLDLALATLGTDDSPLENLVSVLLGKGDGTFTPFTENFFEVGYAPLGIGTGRLRGPNALPDIFTANFNTNDISLLTNDTATCRGKPATIVGTTEDDRLRGTKRVDVIAARAGDDRISGGRRDDLACGGAGDDRLSGGRGDDGLLAGQGADLLSGGRGDDLLRGGDGRRDECRHGPGNDRLRGCERP